MKSNHTIWLYLAGAIAMVGTTIHIAAIFGGSSWFEYFGVPLVVVQSARSGTWMAPIGSAVIAALMALCALYAFSAVGVIRRLPLLRLVLATIGCVCLVRALALVPFAILHPKVCNTFEVVAAIVWGIAGIGFVMGFYGLRLNTLNIKENAAS